MAERHRLARLQVNGVAERRPGRRVQIEVRLPHRVEVHDLKGASLLSRLIEDVVEGRIWRNAGVAVAGIAIEDLGIAGVDLPGRVRGRRGDQTGPERCDQADD
jgi:hypothetical protein